MMTTIFTILAIVLLILIAVALDFLCFGECLTEVADVLRIDKCAHD